MSKIYNFFGFFYTTNKRRIYTGIGLSAILHCVILASFFWFFIKQDLKFKKGQDAQKIKISGFLQNLDSENSQNSGANGLNGLNTHQAKNIDSKNSESKQNAKSKPRKNNAPDSESAKKLDFNNLVVSSNSASSAPGYASAQISPKLSALLRKYQNMDSITKNDVIELYGDELGDYGLAEQDFIVNNLRDIGRITARYLQYPYDAVRLGQQGENIVQFYLHPNGDISELMLIKESGYAILDRNSERTIEIAYKDYPRPIVRTKIRIRVSMSLYYY